MNKKALARMQYKHVQLRPVPIFLSRRPFPVRKRVIGSWLVESTEGSKLRLRHLRTDNLLEVGFDHVVEYRTDAHSDGFLVLKSQPVLTPVRNFLEPLVVVWGSQRTRSGS